MFLILGATVWALLVFNIFYFAFEMNELEAGFVSIFAIIPCLAFHPVFWSS